MYLSIGEVDTRNLYGLKSLVNEQDMHRSIMSMFEDDRQTEKVLYRKAGRDKDVKVCIQSLRKPDAEKATKAGINLLGVRDLSPRLESLSDGDSLRINVLLSPSKSEKREYDRRSKRYSIEEYSERIEWVKKKLSDNGCVVYTVEEAPASSIVFAHGNNRACVPCYQYTAKVEIDNKDAFVETVSNGLGCEKAYGLGLIMFG